MRVSADVSADVSGRPVRFYEDTKIAFTVLFLDTPWCLPLRRGRGGGSWGCWLLVVGCWVGQIFRFEG
jgi:hypothetical protein